MTIATFTALDPDGNVTGFIDINSEWVLQILTISGVTNISLADGQGSTRVQVAESQEDVRNALNAGGSPPPPSSAPVPARQPIVRNQVNATPAPDPAPTEHLVLNWSNPGQDPVDGDVVSVWGTAIWEQTDSTQDVQVQIQLPGSVDISTLNATVGDLLGEATRGAEAFELSPTGDQLVADLTAGGSDGESVLMRYSITYTVATPPA